MSNLNVDEQVTVFDRSILKILKNFVSHEIIVCHEKDPRWFNKRTKSLIQEGTLLLETFQKIRNIIEMITCLNNLNDRLTLSINNAKQSYYSKIVEKFLNTQRSSEAYWYLLKLFLNNRNVPIIQLLHHKGEFVFDFFKKAEVINSFFAEQCFLNRNSSELPRKLKYLTQYCCH